MTGFRLIQSVLPPGITIDKFGWVTLDLGRVLRARAGQLADAWDEKDYPNISILLRGCNGTQFELERTPEGIFLNSEQITWN